MTSYEEMLRGAIYLPPSATKIFFAFDLAIRKRGKIPPGWPADNPTISERDWLEEIVALLVHDLPDWSDHDLRRQAPRLIKHASKHWVGHLIDKFDYDDSTVLLCRLHDKRVVGVDVPSSHDPETLPPALRMRERELRERIAAIVYAEAEPILGTLGPPRSISIAGSNTSRGRASGSCAIRLMVNNTGKTSPVRRAAAGASMIC